MDRTVANGTGFSGTYPSEIASMYENVDTSPDDILLWFHPLNYTHVLHSEKTVIHYFYDAHYSGAETAQTFLTMLETLKGKIDDERYDHIHYRQGYQAGHSIVWRDAISNFYWNLSGIPDESKRVGNCPWRVEAESMTLSGSPACLYSFRNSIELHSYYHEFRYHYRNCNKEARVCVSYIRSCC
jgi:alpha-glucuronidase